MFGILVVAYLFLGGTGAGSVAIASFVDLVWVREPFGVRAHATLDEARSSERVVAFGLLAGFAAVAFGALCLVFDLGRPDRLDTLLTDASPSLIAVGAYAVALLVACAMFLVIARFSYLPAVPRAAVVAVEATAVVLGVVVMLYTGLLLQSAVGVALWRSPLVPMLFTLSSVSCGFAVLLACVRFAGPLDAGSSGLARRFVRVDLVVVALEAMCAALFVGCALASGHPARAASAESLMVGAHAALWWVGFAGCGLVAPFMLEAASVRMRADLARAALSIAVVFVLVGGFCLRASIVGAGGHRTLELEEMSGAFALRLE
ncbi:NrfD/PsrC family molybdoenzyme membrane anchor subunit [Gordonibacter sp. An230]|uniref:NrfD/PsrC family molybdoenzyme membrane anchor subunit n=1 Tax=Gordonibacter sp. An230 TaxID=1965592 RepID=UPI0013A673E6|nr:NrfD/PsrC family molybdoenzyme membrane anchor subunit [Gordonibacter sp. An230]